MLRQNLLIKLLELKFPTKTKDLLLKTSPALKMTNLAFCWFVSHIVISQCNYNHPFLSLCYTAQLLISKLVFKSPANVSFCWFLSHIVISQWSYNHPLLSLCYTAQLLISKLVFKSPANVSFCWFLSHIVISVWSYNHAFLFLCYSAQLLIYKLVFKFPSNSTKCLEHLRLCIAVLQPDFATRTVHCHSELFGKHFEHSFQRFQLSLIKKIYGFALQTENC